MAAVALLIVAGLCSLVRLTPLSWTIKSVPIRDRIWPGLAISFLLLVSWYLKSVTPYRSLVHDRGTQPEVMVLHVEKHGLQIQETRVAIYRDGRAFVTQDQRHLFQFAFPMTRNEVDLNSPDDHLLGGVMKSPPQLRGTTLSTYSPPRSWNVNLWFVSLGTSPGVAEIAQADLPPEITTLFNNVQKTAPVSTYPSIARDLCFGFCYDPDE